MATEVQIKRIAKDHPTYRVGLVAFSTDVTIYGDGTQAPVVVSTDKLLLWAKLSEIGETYRLRNLWVKLWTSCCGHWRRMVPQHSDQQCGLPLVLLEVVMVIMLVIEAVTEVEETVSFCAQMDLPTKALGRLKEKVTMEATTMALWHSTQSVPSRRC